MTTRSYFLFSGAAAQGRGALPILLAAWASGCNGSDEAGQCRPAQPLSAQCCSSFGPDACGAGLFCAAFDGRTVSTCYENGSRQGMEECTEDFQCATGSCNTAEGRCRSGLFGACEFRIGCAASELTCSTQTDTCQLIGDGTIGSICGTGDHCNSGRCVRSQCAAPPNWICPDEWIDDNICDCTCDTSGVGDPGCSPTTCAPIGWTCGGPRYYDQTCDCGCGIDDPACSRAMCTNFSDQPFSIFGAMRSSFTLTAPVTFPISLSVQFIQEGEETTCVSDALTFEASEPGTTAWFQPSTNGMATCLTNGADDVIRITLNDALEATARESEVLGGSPDFAGCMFGVSRGLYFDELLNDRLNGTAIIKASFEVEAECPR